MVFRGNLVVGNYFSSLCFYTLILGNVNRKGPEGKTFFHIPFPLETQPQVLEFFLKSGADMRSKDASGSTALHSQFELPLKSFAQRKNLEVFKLFIKYGADVNAVDSEGQTPLHRAVGLSFLSNFKEIAEILLENGSDPSIRNNAGFSVKDAVESSDFLWKNDLEFMKKFEEALKRSEAKLKESQSGK